MSRNSDDVLDRRTSLSATYHALIHRIRKDALGRVRFCKWQWAYHVILSLAPSTCVSTPGSWKNVDMTYVAPPRSISVGLALHKSDGIARKESVEETTVSIRGEVDFFSSPLGL